MEEGRTVERERERERRNVRAACVRVRGGEGARAGAANGKSAAFAVVSSVGPTPALANTAATRLAQT